jgi:hypothetical protein
MVFCERAFIESHVGVGVSASRAFTVACARGVADLAAWKEKLQSGGDVRQYCEELLAFWCEV